MNSLCKISISFLACLFTLGCGKDENSAASKSELDGTWTQPCGTDDTGEDKDYTIVIQTNSGDAFTTAGENYSDAECKTKDSSWSSVGTFKTGASVAVPAGASEMDISMTSVSFTLHSESLVAGFNSTSGGSAVCGGGWVKDTSKSLTNELCKDDQGFSTILNPVFAIYKLDGSNLFYGADDDTNDGSTAAKRSTSLETRPYVKK